jgi:hypothetical protein
VTAPVSGSGRLYSVRVGALHPAHSETEIAAGDMLVG